MIGFSWISLSTHGKTQNYNDDNRYTNDGLSTYRRHFFYRSVCNKQIKKYKETQEYDRHFIFGVGC
jgi:hypothetical protein